MPQDKDLTIEYGQEDQESEAQGQEATPQLRLRQPGAGGGASEGQALSFQRQM